MADLNWLAQEAKTIHDIFFNLFFAIATVLLLLGIFMEYFKWPIGGMPSFAPLAGRVLVAAFLLYSFPETINTLGDLSDALAAKLGDLNQVKLVLAKIGDKLGEFSLSILSISIREAIIAILSFLCFFILYFTTWVADAFLHYTWSLLYVFSPMLIVLYILPQTASATKALYRSLIEVACWKIVWSVLATLLWSAALTDLNRPAHEANFLTVVCYTLILAGSLILTPVIVHNLAGSGLASFSRTLGGVAVGASMIGPVKVARSSWSGFKSSYNLGHTGTHAVTKKYFPKTHNIVKRMPKFKK